MNPVARLVAWARRSVGAVVLALPEPIRVRLVPHTLGYRAADLPAAIRPPAGEVRLLIAPANYAGQGFEWARAAERLSGVGAANLVISRGIDRGFRADHRVAENVAVDSEWWYRRHAAAVLEGFTHVLVEAERPILGGYCAGDVRREAGELRAAGLVVGYVSHGSDLRLPSRHAAREEWSPFRDQDWPLLPVLEETARGNAAFLAEQDATVFVSTPELVLDHPGAIWLPVVVDPARWSNATPVLRGGIPVVMHAPTNSVIKGTELIEPTTRRLHDEGVIDYRRIEGVPASDMPATLAMSDIILEQFRLGIYSATAIEAMAGGRLVIGYLSEQVRDHVRNLTGLEVPIVQATIDTLDVVLRDVATHPERYRAVAERGPMFAAAVHDGALTASVLEPFLRSGHPPS
ncbi:hypothetical protein [Orlajensenia leifsoniae]|uniref:Glycosyltransferase family 1 protein n=1 Tax=Orlajensenia leifsoniae TaxID=2561933 RepID=A0A4Y9QST4_9MICO|nr:hypothetical protein [Leifsonia flava]TFV94948.1 hypothetical protein E4M00_16295 [Leifsonia flava]